MRATDFQYAAKKKLLLCFSKGRKGSSQKEAHWMDHANEAYPKHLVEDVKLLLKVLVIYIPLPMFWALYDQQGSRWTFQATHMDGALGGTTIIPDQMQIVNPLFILTLIPVFDKVIYPFCAR
jgi:solute carrier family 15 oligopeptide transporter 1